MSDFDKEAERERLREKYEDDRRDRQSTRRMSELLLKGATMTDRHCEECGDPVFRYDGQAFCPTCRSEGAPATGDETPETPAEAGADAPDPATAESEAADGREDAAGDAAVEVSTPTDGAPVDPRPAPDERDASAGPAATPDAPERGAAADAGGRSSARASLERTLARFAREAESAEDPRRARDLLAAAREAAEALAALDRR